MHERDGQHVAAVVALFVVILVVAVLVLTGISKRQGEKHAPFAEDKQTPLWATDEGSDA